VHVRFDATSITGSNILDVRTNLEDFDPELMTGDAWESKKGELA